MSSAVKPRALQFDTVNSALLSALAERNGGPVEAMPTPFATWNRACRDAGGGEGLAKGWHVCIAGATGAGKSLLALNMVATALRSGAAVCYISLEMSQEQLVTRLVALTTGTSVRHLEPGKSFHPQIARTANADFVALLDRTEGSIRVNRYPLRDLTDLDLVFGYYSEREPCTLFVTDYLQLAWAGGARSMLESITEVSHAIRARAREHSIVSIGLSQFNRSTSANRQERPRVEGLMGGSPLENDADQVLLLDHSAYERLGPHAGRTNLLLAKNRHGPQVEIPIVWDYQTLQVREQCTGEDPELSARTAMQEGA